MAGSLSDLIAQKEALERQIRDKQRAEKAAAIAQVRKLMSEQGLTAADIQTPPKRAAKTLSGSKVAPKYRDSVTGATWSGRGLKPKWMVAAIDAGRSIGEFLI